MLEQLQQIDTSVIDELMEIKQERETISGRLAKMIEDQGKVSDVVYRRVRRDYESKISALERKAAPLKDKARQEYAKLKGLLDRIQAAQQATKLDREELEFRHKLGEYPDGDFDEKSAELDAKLDEQTSQVEDAEGVKEQFVAAFDSEEDLATPAPAATPATPPAAEATPEPGITTPQPVSPAPGATAAIPPSQPDDAESEAPIPVPPLADGKPSGEGTVILAEEAPPPEAEEKSDEESPSPAATKEVSPSTTSPSGRTVVLVKGKLIAIDTDLGATEFPLEPLTFIGRTPENQIRLNKPAVSRRHAQIAQSETGYVLRDLNSENGSYVNGERVKERPLADGDRVQIGTVRFVFRAG
ncbi:MAG: FHA domain-containing protein [Holophagales bacterium]|nr:FHA domain-containing protein [Holophagales bacterium]